ncbi:hypothetical protein KTE60_16390 [Burkholderia multivorans]|uniref:hypothetical protein n=2 Tax=Burkholderia multivorans TaxID=87883 RepID=UPI000510438F|nr:hypothetical protein [Burkholderia multivorans]KGB91126.1 hypothetical protein DM81_553 [Burkholderia multivorans]MBU9630866.1 hypothetical protein [Burkholderia multivorans]
MNGAGRFTRGTIAMGILAACALARGAEPSISLKVNLTIPEICTIGPGDRTGAEAETPSVTCTHGTPFMLTRMSTEIPAVPRRRTGAGEAGTWTVTF